SFHATNVVSENFDEGQLFPVEVIISNGGDLLTPESLSRLEAVASTLDNIDGVKEVQTLTRPSGEAIDDFLVRNQLEQANSGMDDMTEGLAEISDGLSEASEGIASSEMAGGDLSELNQGIDDINASLAQISTYMTQTGDAQGASRQLRQVQQGLGTMSVQIAAANEQMTQQQEAASAQMEELSTGLEDATSGIDEIQGGLEEVQTLLGNINDNEAVDQ